MHDASESRPRVVIVGAGFGGLSAATGLRRAAAEVTVIDRRNHHLFQPLLYQVATAALSPADIAAPIRAVLGRQRNTRVMLGTVAGIDKDGRAVIAGGRRIAYDYLVVATGARDAYFGHDEWRAVTSGLKDIEDARAMRRRILIAFEQAEDSDDAEERRRLMTFVIVGGGPTGVELAGALAELSRATLARDFRRIDPATARIVLIEAGPRLLASFPPALSAVAARALTRLGVELRLGAAVTGCHAGGVTLGGERIDSRTVIWAAGVAASPAAEWLGVEPGNGGRVAVGRDLTLPGHPKSSSSAIPPWPRGRTARRCRAWRRWRSSRGATPRGRSGRASPAGPRRRSATATPATWRPSAGARRWRISAGCGCRAGSAGWCGARSTSIS